MFENFNYCDLGVMRKKRNSVTIKLCIIMLYKHLISNSFYNIVTILYYISNYCFLFCSKIVENIKEKNCYKNTPNKMFLFSYLNRKSKKNKGEIQE